MRHPAYPEYKESGVQWLGQVPEHWVVKGLRYICRFAYGDSLAAETREEGCVPVYGSNGKVGTHVHSNTKAPVIVVGRKGSFGKVNFSDEHVFAIDTTYFIDNSCTNERLSWLKYSLLPLRLDSASKDSAVPGLAREDAYESKLPVPPLPEQTAIADFLDRETGRIDRLVAKKRRLIELLREKRTALVSRTVTRGLPADAAREFGLEPHIHFKDSGIDWLGEVPEGWEVKKVQYLARFKGGSTPLTSEDRFWGDVGIPWVSPKDMKAGRIIDTQDHLTTEGVAECASGIVESGHVLIVVRSGILRHTLPVAINDVAVALNQDVRAFLLDDQLNSEYLKWLIEGNQKALLEQWCKSGTTVESIETEYMLSGSLTVPSYHEQTAIAAWLDRETSKIERLVEKVEAAVGRLQEYRSALITAAVTGKIDVREAVNIQAEAV